MPTLAQHLSDTAEATNQAFFRILPIPMHPASRSGNIRPLIPEYPAK